ncbi:MAG: hypothetical protein WC807_18390 [Hyphomicrobium sp.]|jgi:hypothetical protein
MTETTPAAAAAMPASQSSTTETSPLPGPELNIPAPEAATQNTQPPAAETQDTGTPEPQEGKPEGTGEDESKKQNKVPAKERIGQLTAQRNNLQAENFSLRQEIERLKQPLREPGPNATQDEVDRFNVKAAVREQRVEELTSQANMAAEQAMAVREATIEAKAEAVADRMPGLMQQLKALPVLSEPCVEFMAASDKGAEVGYFLTQNPNEAARISALHPYHQGIELARIESRLSAAPQVRKLTSAPPPPPRMPGAPSIAAKDPADMNQAEYSAWYRERQKNKA